VVTIEIVPNLYSNVISVVLMRNNSRVKLNLRFFIRVDEMVLNCILLKMLLDHDWINTVWNILSIVLVIEHHERISIDAMRSGSTPNALGFSLNIVSLVVLMEPSIVVSSWAQFGIMKLLMIVTDSWHVFWSINYIWVVRRKVIHLLSSVNSLGMIIKIKPCPL
jgi:hypothetical protein